jgi:hypothetical protein
MHPLILDALARAKADELIRRREARSIRASLARRPKQPSRPVHDHRYTLPDVVEVARQVGPGTFDETTW